MLSLRRRSCRTDLPHVRRLTAESDIFHVPNVFNFTYGDLADVISAAFPGLSVTFGEDRPQSYPADDHVLRLRYGWSPRYSLKQDLPLVLQRWKEARAQEQSGKHPIWDFLRNHSKPWIAFEICVTFILEELLRTAVQGDSQLGTVDLRLFFVVIVGTMYGMNAGVFAPRSHVPAWRCRTRRTARHSLRCFTTRRTGLRS